MNVCNADTQCLDSKKLNESFYFRNSVCMYVRMYVQYIYIERERESIITVRWRKREMRTGLTRVQCRNFITTVMDFRVP